MSLENHSLITQFLRTQALRYPVVIFFCEGLKASSTFSWLVEKSLTYRLYLRSLHHRYLSSQIKHNTRLVMAIPVPDPALRSIARIVDCKICFNTSNHQRYELLALVRPKQMCIQWTLILYKFCVSTWNSSSPRRNTLHLTRLRIFENAQTFSEYQPLTKCCTKNLTIPPSFKFNIIQSFAFILTPYILHLIDLVRFDISWNLNQRAFTVVLVFSFLSSGVKSFFSHKIRWCVFLHYFQTEERSS